MSVKPTICINCSEAFELKPGKPGYANRCPSCSKPRPLDPVKSRRIRRLEHLKLFKAAVGNEIATKIEKKAVAERAGRHPFFIENYEKSITKSQRISSGIDLLVAEVQQSLQAD